MKIKRKVQKTLPQLIEWVEKNGIRNHVFISDIDRNEVEINIHGCIFCKYITLKDTFTVEVEEEITEDTELDGLVELGDDGAGEDFFFSRGLSINDCKDEFTQAFYILNDDYTMTLIWRDGKLEE